MSEQIRKYAVVGSPIAHSLSPQIHQLFAKQFDSNISYEKFEPVNNDFEKLVTDFFQNGGSGLNVTLPYKARALKMATKSSNIGTVTGAVNTLKINEDKSIDAINTDGPGLIKDLTKRHGVDLKDAKIAILGAGGATSGVLYSLLQIKPARIQVYNRTASRAAILCQQLALVAKEYGVELTASGLDNFGDNAPYDLIINSTSAGHQNKDLAIDHQHLKGAEHCYDLSYGKACQAFKTLADTESVKFIDGFGMLVEQAAFAFAYWEKMMPDSQSVYEIMLKEINND